MAVVFQATFTFFYDNIRPSTQRGVGMLPFLELAHMLDATCAHMLDVDVPWASIPPVLWTWTPGHSIAFVDELHAIFCGFGTSDAALDTVQQILWVAHDLAGLEAFLEGLKDAVRQLWEKASADQWSEFRHSIRTFFFKIMDLCSWS